MHVSVIWLSLRRCLDQSLSTTSLFALRQSSASHFHTSAFERQYGGLGTSSSSHIALWSTESSLPIINASHLMGKCQDSQFFNSAHLRTGNCFNLMSRRGIKRWYRESKLKTIDMYALEDWRDLRDYFELNKQHFTHLNLACLLVKLVRVLPGPLSKLNEVTRKSVSLLLDDIAELVSKRAKWFNARSAGYVIADMAYLGYKNPDLIYKLLQFVTYRMRETNETLSRDLAYLLHGLAGMEIALTPELAEVLYPWLQKKIRSSHFGTGEAPNCRPTPPAKNVAVILIALAHLPKTGPQPPYAVLRAFSLYMSLDGHSFEPLKLAKCMSALAELKFDMPLKHMNKVIDYMGEFENVTWSTYHAFLYGYSKMSHDQGRSWAATKPRLLEAYQDSSVESMAELNNRQLVNCIRNFFYFGVRPRGDFLLAHLRACNSQISTCTEKQKNRLMYAYHGLGIEIDGEKYPNLDYEFAKMGPPKAKFGTGLDPKPIRPLRADIVTKPVAA